MANIIFSHVVLKGNEVTNISLYVWLSLFWGKINYNPLGLYVTFPHSDRVFERDIGLMMMVALTIYIAFDINFWDILHGSNELLQNVNGSESKTISQNSIVLLEFKRLNIIAQKTLDYTLSCEYLFLPLSFLKIQ